MFGWDPTVCVPNDKLHVNDLGINKALLEFFKSYVLSLPNGKVLLAWIDSRFHQLALSSSPLMKHRFYEGTQLYHQSIYNFFCVDRCI